MELGIGSYKKKRFSSFAINLCVFFFLFKKVFKVKKVVDFDIIPNHYSINQYNPVMATQQPSKSAMLKKDSEQIAKEEGEFTQRLAKELVKLAHEGIGLFLPIMVVDHVADTKSKIKKCAKEGVEVDDDDGLKLFKIRRVPVKAQVDGNLITRTEVIIIVKAEFCDAHQAIYRMLNQTVATKLRIGVYVFHHDGCKYPDRTMCGEAIDTRLFANNSSQSSLNTRDEPSGLSLGEKSQPKPLQIHQASTTSASKPSKLSTRDKSPELSLGEKSQSKPLPVQRASILSAKESSRPSTLDEPSG